MKTIQVRVEGNQQNEDLGMFVKIKCCMPVLMSYGYVVDDMDLILLRDSNMGLTKNCRESRILVTVLLGRIALKYEIIIIL